MTKLHDENVLESESDDTATTAQRRAWGTPTLIVYSVESVTEGAYAGGGSDGMFFS